MGVVVYLERNVRAHDFDSPPTGSMERGYLLRIVASNWAVHLELHPKDSGSDTNGNPPIYIAALGRADVAEITTALKEATERLVEDAYGHPIITKTSELFDPRIRRQFGDLVALVEINVATYDALTARSYLFKTNSDTWNGRVPPGQGLCTNCGADVVFDAQLGQYFRKKVAVQIREQGRMSSPDKAWWWRQLAQGHQWLMPREGAGLIDPAGADNLEWCVDYRGYPTGVPQLHDPDTGRPFLKKNKNNQWVVDYSPSRAKFYEYAIYKSLSFSGLLS
jgi:hypothetical protein